MLVSGEDGITVDLVDGNGAAVPGSLKTATNRKFFAPNAPLAVGSYKLRYQSWAPGVGAAPTLEESSFTVTAAVAAPTGTGTLSVAATDRGMRSVITSSGSCTEEADASMVRLALSIDPGLAPYANVVAWETKVDGNYWSGAQGTLPTSTGVRTALNLFTACDAGGTGGRDNGLKPGIHDVQLTPILVGSVAAITPATIRVTVSCGTDNGTVHASAVTDPPKVQPPGDIITPQPNPPGNETPDDDNGTADQAHASDGCAAAPGSSTSFGFASIASALGLVAAGIRRRRSPRRGPRSAAR